MKKLFLLAVIFATGCGRDQAIDQDSTVSASAGPHACWTDNTQRDKASLEKVYAAFDRMLSAERGVAAVDCAGIRAYLVGTAVRLPLSGLSFTNDQMRDAFLDLNDRMTNNETVVTAVDMSHNQLVNFDPATLSPVARNGLAYLNISHNAYSNNLDAIVVNLTKSALQYLIADHNKISGDLLGSFTDKLTNLEYLDVSANPIGDVTFADYFPKLVYLDISRPEPSTTPPYFTISPVGQALPNLMHLGVANRQLAYPDKYLTKIGRLGSLDARNVVNSSNKSITASASMSDTRGSSLPLNITLPDQTWRTDCTGTAKCSITGRMPTGGCDSYRKLLELKPSVPAERTAAFAKALEPYLPFCGA